MSERGPRVEALPVMPRLILKHFRLTAFPKSGYSYLVSAPPTRHNATGRIHPVGRFGATLPKR